MLDNVNLAAVQVTLLGALLHDPSRLGEVMTEIKPEMFPAKTLRPVYDAMCSLHLAGAPIDPVSVRKAAGEEYGIVIDDALKCDTADIMWYCSALQEYKKLYDIGIIGSQLAAAENLETAEHCIDDLNRLMVVHGSREIISAGDAADTYILQNRETPEYIRWGIPQLDKTLYAELGDLVVIGGYPSAGKTLLSLQMAATLATKYSIGYFSHETTPRKLTDRLMCYMSQVPLSSIKTRTMKEDEWTAVKRAAEMLKRLKLDFISAGGMTVSDMQAVALNKHYQIVVVDYLQLVPSYGKSRTEEVTNISKDLHVLAQSHGMMVIALAQLTRPEKSTGKPLPPTMASFRESGQIEQDADIAMLLYPVDPNNNDSNRYLKIGKNKDGKRIRMEMEFRGAVQTLMPVKQPVRQGIAEVNKALKEEEQAKKYREEQITFQEVSGNDAGLPF